MSRDTSFHGTIRSQEEASPVGEAQDTFLRELAQLEADIEKEEATFKNLKVFSKRTGFSRTIRRGVGYQLAEAKEGSF